MSSPLPSPASGICESVRIEFLLRRDGYEATRTWVETTLHTYRSALERPGSHARDPAYRPLFEKSVREFQQWLDTSAPGAPPA